MEVNIQYMDPMGTSTVLSRINCSAIHVDKFFLTVPSGTPCKFLSFFASVVIQRLTNPRDPITF